MNNRTSYKGLGGVRGGNTLRGLAGSFIQAEDEQKDRIFLVTT
jgi:hypothetical protein